MLAAHLLLLLLLLRSQGGRDGSLPADPSASSTLVWLEDTPPSASPPERPGTEANKLARPRHAAARHAESANTAPSSRAPHDWRGELETLPHAPAGSAAPRPFGQIPAPTLRPCDAPTKPFDWSPEPKRAGLAGGLPYVRLGRCIVGLGFFGCRVSEAPPPNSRLLDGMKDAPAGAGSVPDDSPCAR